MSKAKHTPGPWVVGDDYEHDQNVIGPDGFPVASGLSDAFSPETASCVVDGYGGWVKVNNLYHLKLKGKLPEHLGFLDDRLR